jgi:GT2 family glycosyltransferase
VTDLSVVCVLHDSAGVLPDLLRSLGRHLPRAQLVAVDAASCDGGAELARAAGAEVVALGENPGFGAACNAGLERVRHPACALLNPDCELEDGGLERLVAAAVARDGLWAPRLVDGRGRPERSAHPLPGTLGALVPALVHPPVLPRALRMRAEPWRTDRPRSVGWAVAACIVARTATLRRLGPFDPRQFLFYEDMDLCLRARAAGVPTILDPSVRIRHLGGHATRPAYGGEPYTLLARRRREVVAANRGRAALRLDDAAQILTFATRRFARRALGPSAAREAAQLAALQKARAGRPLAPQAGSPAREARA